MQSALKFYSYGYVSQAKEINSHEIHVYPVETLSHHEGSIAPSDIVVTGSGIDADGKPYSTQLTSVNYIIAEWFDLSGGNRVTPPDVRRREEVVIMRYGDCDKYYWVPAGRNKSLRRLETVKFRVSATTDDSVTELNDDNSYVVELSSHLKEIKLFTSKENGEFCRYFFHFNMGEGYAKLGDDLNNLFSMDSKNTVLQLVNADNSILQLDKKNGLFSCDDSIQIKTKDYKLNCETMTQTATNWAKINGTNTMTLGTQTFRLDSNNNTINGDTNLLGSFNAKGGSFTHNGVNVGGDHVHVGVTPGSPTQKSSFPDGGPGGS